MCYAFSLLEKLNNGDLQHLSLRCSKHSGGNIIVIGIAPIVDLRSRHLSRDPENKIRALSVAETPRSIAALPWLLMTCLVDIIPPRE